MTAKDVVSALRLPPAEERKGQLDAEQKHYQTILGELAFPQPVLVRCGLAINMCMTVMCYPPRGPILPDHPGVTALLAVKLVLESAYDARYDGITAGGDGDESSPRLRADLHAELDMSSPPPLSPEVYGDATWSAAPHDRYALAITFNRLLIRYQVKVARTVADCSMSAEMHPTTVRRVACRRNTFTRFVVLWECHSSIPWSWPQIRSRTLSSRVARAPQ